MPIPDEDSYAPRRAEPLCQRRFLGRGGILSRRLEVLPVRPLRQRAQVSRAQVGEVRPAPRGTVDWGPIRRPAGVPASRTGGPVSRTGAIVGRHTVIWLADLGRVGLKLELVEALCYSRSGPHLPERDNKA